MREKYLRTILSMEIEDDRCLGIRRTQGLRENKGEGGPRTAPLAQA